MDNGVDIGYGTSVSWRHFDEESQKIFKQALFESKGRANNQLGGLLLAAGAPVEDIVRYASRVSGNKFMDNPIRHKKSTPAERIARSVFKTVPNFWDTISGKKLREKGDEVLKKLGLDPADYLPVSRLDIKRAERALHTAFRLSGKSYSYCDELRMLSYDTTLARKLEGASIFEPLTDVKFGNDDAISKLQGCTSLFPEEDWLPDYGKNRRYEIESLANLDPEVALKMRPIELFMDILQNCFCRLARQTSSYAIETLCVIEGFYAVCTEMGIVGVLDDSVLGRHCVTQAASVGIMKNVIKLAGTYRRLVKGGFAESVARETVLAEINENVAKRATRPRVRFYGRVDYKDTPEEERVKVKTTGGGGTSRKTVMTIEEFAKANGLVKEDE